MHVYIGEVLYCPYDKRLTIRHYRRRFYSVPFVRHKDTYSVLLTHDNLCKLTPVFRGVATILWQLAHPLGDASFSPSNRDIMLYWWVF